MVMIYHSNCFFYSMKFFDLGLKAKNSQFVMRESPGKGSGEMTGNASRLQVFMELGSGCLFQLSMFS